jgi:hypothetical protein
VLAERYARLDSRFVPQITIGPGSQLPPTRPGVAFSKISEHFRVDFVPRDPAAYLDDPVHTRFTVSPELLRRFEEALDKGLPLTLPITNFVASTPLLAELEGLAEGIQLTVASNIPPQLAGRQLLVKMVTGEEPCQVSLPFFDLRVVRFGRMEFELKSTTDSPLGVSVFVSRNTNGDSRARIKLRMQLVGVDVRAASKVIRFLDTFQRSRQFQVVAIENDMPIMWQTTGYESTATVSEDVATLIHRAAQIAEYFDKDIPLPPGISNEDLTNARTLHLVLSGEPFRMTDWSIDVVKEGDSQIDRINLLNGTQPFYLKLLQPSPWKILKLFGTEIDTGPVIIELTDCSLKSPDEALASFDRTAIGSAFRLDFVVNGPCRFLPPSSMNDPEDPLLGTGGKNGRLDVIHDDQAGSAE